MFTMTPHMPNSSVNDWFGILIYQTDLASPNLVRSQIGVNNVHHDPSLPNITNG
jgi:hypothetical protein